MLNGESLFDNSKVDSADLMQALPISDLKTSQEIIDAIKQKTDTSESRVVKNPNPQNSDLQDKEPSADNYSRPLILLKQPKGEAAHENGTISLKVTFLASGKIGNIYVLSGKSNALINNAVKAARQIKFLPAEIDGKKVDSMKKVEYSFSFRSIENIF